MYLDFGGASCVETVSEVRDSNGGKGTDLDLCGSFYGLLEGARHGGAEGLRGAVGDVVWVCSGMLATVNGLEEVSRWRVFMRIADGV